MSLPPVNSAPQAEAAVNRPSAAMKASRALRHPAALWGLIWTVVALVLVGYAYKRLYAGDLVDADAMDYAQIARNIATGHGYATSILRPLAVTGIVTVQNGTTPDISRAPLYPFVLMLAFVLHGGHGGGNVVVLVSLLFFLASAFAVYRLAESLLPSGQPWAALLSVGLYLLGGSALGYAVSGLPVSLATLLVSLLFLALHRAHETGGKPAAGVQTLAVGLLLGLCYLVQYSLLILVIPTLVYVYASRAPARAVRGAMLCAAGFLLVTLPWLIRNAVVSHGNPFFSLLMYGVMADTSEYPGASTIYRSVLPEATPFSFFFAHLPEMAAKAGRGLTYYQSHLPEAFSVWIFGPAVAALLWRFADVRANALRGYAAVCLLLLALATAIFAPSAEVLAPFAPVIVVLGVGFVCELMAQQRWQPLSQRLMLWGWGTLVGLGLLGALIGRGPASLNPVQNALTMLANPPIAFPLNQSARAEIRSGAIITDTPWEVTWRAQLPAVWLPRDNQSYEAVGSALNAQPGQSLALTSLLLTPEIAAYNNPGEADSWIALSGHPQAWEARAQALAEADRLPRLMKLRVALASSLIAAGKLNMTEAQLNQQIAQAKTIMPTAIKNQKIRVQQAFDDTYGPISEIIAGFATDPQVLQQREPNGAPSTLFLPRNFMKSLRSQQAPGVTP